MTEDEAKTKCCPFREIKIVAYAKKAEIIERDHELYRCIGSDCMAWRWVKEKSGTELSPDSDKPNKLRIYIPDGYCGLAGNGRQN